MGSGLSIWFPGIVILLIVGRRDLRDQLMVVLKTEFVKSVKWLINKKSP